MSSLARDDERERDGKEGAAEGRASRYHWRRVSVATQPVGSELTGRAQHRRHRARDRAQEAAWSRVVHGALPSLEQAALNQMLMPSSRSQIYERAEREGGTWRVSPTERTRVDAPS